jgi:4-diphosphocytidyl-2-C-methyl-D-erythritol kinase
VLAIPSFGVATADAYRWFDEAQEGGRVQVSGASASENCTRPLFPNVPLINDLEAPVIERHPEIGQLKQRFTDRGALMAGMSGSGSTVYGVFTSARTAAAAAQALASSGARILTARFLGRSTRRRR